MKKISLVLAILLIAMFALFALGSGEDTTVDQGNDSAANNAQSGNIGNYSVTIDSCRIAKSYDNKSVVIVKYTFKNVNDENPTAFYVAFNDHVYQNGVGLNKAYVLDNSANYSADNQTKEIKKGASIEVEVAYELNDTTTSIEVEVEELFSFNDTKITKTFSIAG